MAKQFLRLAWHGPGQSKKICKKIVRVEGLEYLEEAVSANKGLLLLVPHQGNWEILTSFFSQHMFVTWMYKPHKISLLDRYIFNTRKRANIGLAPANQRGVSMIFKELKDNGTVAILPDQVPDDKGGVYADVFGKTALTGKLVSKIAAKTNCSLLCCYTKRLTNGHYCVVIEPANESIRHNDPIVAATAINQSVEMCIANSPEQYQWSYKRFRQPPNGADDIYKKR